MKTAAHSDEIARLRNRREQSQRNAHAVRQTREKLVNGSDIKPEFEYELLTMFVRNELGAAVTMPALSIIFSLASLFWATAWEAALWLTIVISAKVVLLELCRRFLNTPRHEINVKKWRRYFVCAELLNGTCWAGFALVGIGNHSIATDA
ncbi:MAG: sensor histidine kinase, partial [Pseudomonadota bacterium]